MPPGVAADPWRRWDVKSGNLTRPGAKAVTLLGSFGRAVLAAPVVASGSCPAAGSGSVSSDSDEGTIATADAWIAGFAPGCASANHHKPQGETDHSSRRWARSSTSMRRASTPPSGKRGAQADSPRWRLRAASNCAARPYLLWSRAACTLRRVARADPIGTASRRSEAGLRGRARSRLHRRSDPPARIFRRQADVGGRMGRTTAAHIAAVSALHAIEYSVLARPNYVAASNIAPVTRRLLAALTDHGAETPTLTLMVSDDTQIVALGDLLDLTGKWPALPTTTRRRMAPSASTWCATRLIGASCVRSSALHRSIRCAGSRRSLQLIPR